MELKILFINLPCHGHVIPTIGLVQELVKAGHPVTYLMPCDWADKLAECGADFLGYDNSPKLDQQIRNAFFKAEEVIADFDLLIYEQFFFAGKHLAEKHGKKRVRSYGQRRSHVGHSICFRPACECRAGSATGSGQGAGV